MLVSPHGRAASGDVRVSPNRAGVLERWNPGPADLTHQADSGTIGLLLRDLRHTKARAASDLADWLVHLDLSLKGDRTIYEYHRKAAPLLRAYPHLSLQEITHSHINDVLRLIPQRSRHISRSVYNQFFTWAYKDERIARNPMDKVPAMPHPHRRPRDIFSEAERALLEGLPTPDGQLWTILFATGIRRGEARNLQRRHIDLARAKLTVYNGKGRKDRIVPLFVHVQAAIDELIVLEGINPDEHLWYSLRGEGRYQRRLRRDPIGDTTFSRGPNDPRPGWYERCIATAGVRYLNPHQTRHTFGHWLKDHGYTLEERALFMGHDDPNTTKKYYPAMSIEDLARKVAQL